MAQMRQESTVVPNTLNRQFRTGGPRTVLLTDITYIPRRKHKEEATDKYSYLSVIMDAFTKEILAYVCSLSVDVDFVLETVNQLMDKHGNELKTDTLIHSDQGCHYTSHRFREIIADVNLRQSMSRRGNCWDNSPQESLFGHMKDEIHFNPTDDHRQISRKIDNWVEYYNNDRPQWGLAKLTPCEFAEYVKTGVYPLSCEPPKKAKKLIGGSAPYALT
jgi:transposase InsO family protein